MVSNERLTVEEIQNLLKPKKQEILDLKGQVRKKKDEFRKLAEDLNICMVCPYDGLFRCEACQDAYYEGFNVKNVRRQLWR